MNLFKRNNTSETATKSANQAAMSEMVLKAIHDGVIITDKNGVIQFINPAAVTMTGCGSSNQAVGLDYGLVVRIESKEGRELPENENPLIQAMKTNQPLEPHQVCLVVGQTDKRIPVSISVLPAEGLSQNRIITFRDITKELEEEGEQTEFISTASHEMRTPVATIDGYLSLTLNPQTASIDERARGYLTAAQNASKHLGKLFQDLLDVTKLDDGRIRPQFVPAEMVSFVESIVKDYAERAKEAKINLKFGSSEPQQFGEARRVKQVVYSSIDVDFMREVLDNLVDNALKYTPAGGSIYVNVRGDGDRVLINITDTGVGISSEDLSHIFQKFYRVDNSDTRTIGGTGLGLYLVKQRVEAMGGRVWAESAFGEGSTFFVSLPRLSQDEYDKRIIAVQNREMQNKILQQAATAAPATPTPAAATPVAPTPAAPAPAVPAPAIPAPVATAPVAAAPVAPVTPQAIPAATTTAPQTQPRAPVQPQPVAQTPAQQPTIKPVVQAQPQPQAGPELQVQTQAQAPQQIDINLNGGQK